MRYRRSNTQGATWFFTINLADRETNMLVRHIDILRNALRKVKAAHPFEIVAAPELPDHLHAIWRLPEGDADYPVRWSLLRAGFSPCLPKKETIQVSRAAERERGIWQRRYLSPAAVATMHELRRGLHAVADLPAIATTSARKRIDIVCYWGPPQAADGVHATPAGC